MLNLFEIVRTVVTHDQYRDSEGERSRRCRPDDRVQQRRQTAHVYTIMRLALSSHAPPTALVTEMNDKSRTDLDSLGETVNPEANGTRANLAADDASARLRSTIGDADRAGHAPRRRHVTATPYTPLEKP